MCTYGDLLKMDDSVGKKPKSTQKKERRAFK